jgi:hypothetical protein
MFKYIKKANYKKRDDFSSYYIYVDAGEYNNSAG